VKLESVRRSMCCALVMAMWCALSACTSAPKKDDAAVKLAAQAQLNDSLAAADKAQKAGNTEQALTQLDVAIKADPASKEPWLRKAQIHFEAKQYGLAITEAQEVLQRDVNDLTAKSIQAVSGLRVSAQALEQLRKANEVTGSTRSEAESVARLIREALGEPIIPPTAAGPTENPVKPRPFAARVVPRGPAAVAVRPNTGVAAAPLAAPANRSPSSVAASPGPATGGRNNPFGALQ
jgi:tetratricopeptide (TPR) repeat protein